MDVGVEVDGRGREVDIGCCCERLREVGGGIVEVWGVVVEVGEVVEM